ncbi:unnamed protein product [Parnassius apollo]|uniref:(apollo) hypothetical protein n=1 Tax=Parnassius apollo TaxID=110799 RepID=A0A8S3XSV1_PARAO|nr:unnamed protein product [Parnassius apollo]
MNKMKDIQRRVFKRRLLALVDEIMAEKQYIVLNSPSTLLSTPSPINTDILVDTSTMNDDSNSQLTLYYQSIPLLSNQDNQNDNIEDQEE